MRRFALILILALGATAPAAFAQATDQTTTTTRTTYNTDDGRERGEVGVFLDYLRLQHASLNQFGLGGRVGFNLHPHVQLEAEGAYDFRQTRTASVTDVTTGLPTTYRANLRTMSFLAGPKFQ